MTTTEAVKETQLHYRVCPCGCGQSYELRSGFMYCGAGSQAIFRAALMHGENFEPHLWLLLGTGSWIKHEALGSWVTLHTWLANGELITRVEDPSDSPFTGDDACNERMLSREEVFSQRGGPEWAFERRVQLLAQHPEVAKFIGGVDA